jgi:hypothetical protein
MIFYWIYNAKKGPKKQKIQYIKKKDTNIKSIDKRNNNNCINNYFDDNEDENQLILNFD